MSIGRVLVTYEHGGKTHQTQLVGFIVHYVDITGQDFKPIVARFIEQSCLAGANIRVPEILEYILFGGTRGIIKEVHFMTRGDDDDIPF